jgi:tRNA dimethylallyltransferase
VNKKIILIYGPTAVGKTDFAELVAQGIPSEIVNIDMGQCYAPLTIGTAKPDWRQSKIPHHLFDIITTPTNISVREYRDRILEVIEGIWSRGNFPLLVGGSGFYIKSLFFAPQAQHTKEAYTKVLLIKHRDRWQALQEIDPERAQALHPHDTYRIDRALGIWYATGTLPSLYKPVYKPIGSYCYIDLARDRPQLYERINLRTKAMLEQGWIQEVKNLQGTKWESFLKEKKLIGYDDILEFLKGHGNRDQLEQTIAQKTRHYAKQQITFGKMLYTDLEKKIIETVEPSQCMRFNLSTDGVKASSDELIRCINQSR